MVKFFVKLILNWKVDFTEFLQGFVLWFEFSFTKFYSIFRLLINHGAEIDALDENDCTPLMFAAMQNHPHCVNELLSHGADFTKSDFNGETALSLAVNNGSKMAQRVLESHVLSVLKGMVSGKDNGQVLAN